MERAWRRATLAIAYAYVGCYTSPQRRGRGEGIAVHRVDTATGGWTPVQVVKTADNPSWLALDRGRRFRYAAHGDGDVVSAFRRDEATVTVAVLPIRTDGSLGPVSDLATLSGTPGPHPTQQQSSHPHDIVFDPRGRFVVVPDKGLDATFVFALDGAGGKLTPTGQVIQTPSPSSIVFR
jgi:6-phosphogluconolactonase (cycloisomerase 2 family)